MFFLPRRILFLLSMPLLLSIIAACDDSDGTTATPTAAPVTLTGAHATLFDLLNKGLGATYRIRYERTTAEGEQGQSVVVYSLPPRARVDTIPPGASEPSSLAIADEDRAVSCVGGPDDWECSEFELSDGSLLVAAGPVVFLTPADLQLYDVQETEARTIVGQTARCFALTDREAGERLEYCLNADGVPLYSSPIFGTVEATGFSRDVSVEDFAPPAEPRR